MGKMMVALVIIFIIELGMSLFISCYPGEGVTCEGKTYLFTFLMNPQDWSASNWIEWITSNVLLFGGTLAIVAGLTLFTKYEFLVYMGVAAVFWSFGETIFHLWQQLANISFFGDAGTPIATLLIGGLLIYFMISVLDYARGRD